MLKMCQVGRHFYDPHRPESVPQHRSEHLRIYLLNLFYDFTADVFPDIIYE